MRVAALLVITGCAAEVREKPEAPDMDALVAAYANPTRTFDAATAAEIEMIVESKVASLLDLDALADQIEEAFTSIAADDTQAFTGRAAKPVEGRITSIAAGAKPVDLEGEGFARIERICRGHGDPAPAIDKDANGYLSLTVGYTEEGLDSVIFGGAFGCAEQIAGSRVRFDGQTDLYIGNNLKLVDLPTTPVLFRLSNFALEVDGTVILDGGFDFQVCRGTASACMPGHVEVLLNMPNNDTLVLFYDPGNNTGGFRGANGIWTCDFLAARCTDTSGNVVTTPEYNL